MNQNIYQYAGYGVKEKVAKKHIASASYVYLPARWAGKRIAVILLDEPELAPQLSKVRETVEN